MPPFEFSVDESDLLLCAAVPAARGRPRKWRFKHGGKVSTKRAYHCGRCHGFNHNIQSCPYTEGHIPTEPSIQPLTGSGTSHIEDPVVIDSEDKCDERNVILPPESSALQQRLDVQEPRVVRAEAFASLMGVDGGEDEGEEIEDFTQSVRSEGPPANCVKLGTNVIEDNMEDTRSDGEVIVLAQPVSDISAARVDDGEGFEVLADEGRDD